MNTYFLPGSIDRPTVIASAKTEQAARTKIAEALIAKGEDDPREFVDYEIFEVENGDVTVLDDESFFLI